MDWFNQWWSALELAEQIMYCIAIPATLVLIIQTIMICIGFGQGGEGVSFSDTSGIDGLDAPDGMDAMDAMDATDVPDATGDGGNPADFASMRLFTVQGVVAFLCVFGWSGIICLGSGLHIALSIAISLVLGFAAMLGVAKIIQLSGRLAQNGNFNMKNAIGEIGSVYIPIPAQQKGTGKITISVGERFMEFDAVTDGEALSSNTRVRVTDILAENVLVVEIAE